MNTPRILLAAALLAAATPATAGFFGGVGLVSDWNWRGISKSGEDFALQGDVGYSFDDLGIYGGVFASTIDFGDEIDGASYEGDIYAGWKYLFDNGLGFDVGYRHYTFDDSTPDLDYGEFYAGGIAGPVEFYLHYTDDFFGSDLTAWYMDIAGNIDFVWDSYIRVKGGYSFGDAFDNGGQFVTGLPTYLDWRVSWIKEMGGLQLEAFYADNDLTGDNFTEVFGSDIQKTTFGVAVSFSFGDPPTRRY